MERYHRQVILEELGEKGQQKLLLARVLVIGAGGLGCPVLQYLAAAGVGTIGIVDDDKVSVTNLQRQVLYDMTDIGALKVERAAMKLQRMNPGIAVIPYALRLNNRNALDILNAYDIVVDSSDNFATRYMINDACVLLNKPLVYGAVSRFEGQVAVFNIKTAKDSRINYRDLFPVQPEEGEVANCAEAGVLGVLPGIIGSMQAGEVIKLITNIGEPLHQLQTFNLLTNEWYTWQITPNPNANAFAPKDTAAFIDKEYNDNCGIVGFVEINVPDFDNLLRKNETLVIDVREPGEQPVINEFEHLQIPLSQLKKTIVSIDGEVLVAVCQSGNRSRIAAQLLAATFPTKKIYSLQGGIAGWKQKQLYKI